MVIAKQIDLSSDCAFVQANKRIGCSDLLEANFPSCNSSNLGDKRN